MADDSTTSLEEMLAALQAKYGGQPDTDTTPPQQMASVDPTAPAPSAAPTPAPAPAPAPVPQAPAQPPAISNPATSILPSVQADAKPPSPYMVAVGNYESHNNPNAQSGNSTAGGRWQITDPTFDDLQKNHPDHQYTGKNDPQAMQDLTDDNTKALRLGLGRAPDQLEIYAAHFLGPTGAIKFLQAPPNTPVDQVVSPQALAANHKIFYDPSGKPYTTGQVESMVSKNVFGGDSSGSQPPAQSATATAPAAAPYAAPQTPGDALFGQQKADIAKYMAGQPAMWAKLNDLQNVYRQAQQPTFNDRLSDAISQFQQQQAVAQAGSHATAGGVLNHELPNADAFVKALQSSHTIDTEAREARLRAAQQDYQAQTGLIQAKNTVDQANLGLTGGLAKETGEYNLNAGANALKLAQFGLDQQKGVNEQLEKLVPNPETRAVVSAEFARTANPNAGYNANMQVLNSIIQRVQKGTQGTAATPDTPAVDGTSGMQISAKEPAKLVDVTYTDPKTGQMATTEQVNTATPAGIARLAQLRSMPGFQSADTSATPHYYAITKVDPTTGKSVEQKVDGNSAEGRYAIAQSPTNAPARDLSSPQNNVSTNVTNNSGGDNSSGSGKEPPLDEQYIASVKTRQTVDYANNLLEALHAAGANPSSMNNDIALKLRSAARGLGITEDDNLALNELYNKTMKKIQTMETGPMLRSLGTRPTQLEYQQVIGGNPGDQASYETAKAYLNNVGATADWNGRRVDNLVAATKQARHENNTAFDPRDATMDWIKQQDANGNHINFPPDFVMPTITPRPAVSPTTGVVGRTATQPTQTTQPPPTKTLSNGRVTYWNKDTQKYEFTPSGVSQ